MDKTLESLLYCKEIQPVHPKGDQSWVFIGRTDIEAEIPILWPPHEKSWLIWKDPVSGQEWGQEEKGMTEDEIVEWRHRLNGHGFGWTPGVGDRQSGLVCCRSWGCKESHSATKLNWTYWGWPCAPNSLVVGLQLAFHSHGTTSLLLIAYTKYLFSFGFHLSLNCLHMLS